MKLFALIALTLIASSLFGGCANGIVFGVNYGDRDGRTYGAYVRLDPSFVKQKK